MYFPSGETFWRVDLSKSSVLAWVFPKEDCTIKGYIYLKKIHKALNWSYLIKIQGFTSLASRELLNVSKKLTEQINYNWRRKIMLINGEMGIRFSLEP